LTRTPAPLTTDGQINALAKSIFNVLPDNAARRRFVTWIWEYEPSVTPSSS
jgi:hypothetical protein